MDDELDSQKDAGGGRLNSPSTGLKLIENTVTLYAEIPLQQKNQSLEADWISEKLGEVNAYARNLIQHPVETTFDESKQVAYDIVDLIFLNDEYCLFR